MAFFRKKPVVVEANQLTWGTWSLICDFVPKPAFDRGVYVHPTEDGVWSDLPDWTDPRIGLLLNTLEGQMLATEGDWIIKGVKGEFYPCKPDIFETTYEPIGPPE